MLDITQLRRDLPAVVAKLETRKNPQPFLDVDRFGALEAERKTLQTRTEQLQARRNALSKQIGQMKGKGEDTSVLMAEVNGIADEMKCTSWPRSRSSSSIGIIGNRCPIAGVV